MFCRLFQVDQNRTSVHNEIKKAICSLILEINKKGKMLVNQLEVLYENSSQISSGCNRNDMIYFITA